MSERNVNQERVPVLIVGGGLSGLSSSVFLAWHGIRSLTVERYAETSLHPKARAINPRTTELFRSVGLEEEVLANRSPIADNTDLIHVVTLAGEERVRLPRPPTKAINELSPSGWALIDQNRLEPVLAARVREAGSTIRYRTELVSLDQDGDGVRAVLRDRDSGAQTEVHADYLIAADGNRSPVRALLGIGSQGPGTLSNMVSFFFRADLDAAVRGRKIIAAYANNEHLRGTFMPLDNDQRWVFNLSYYPERGEKPEDFDEQRCVESVRIGVGIDDLPVELETTALTPWEIAARWADTFRRDRVLIVGDAAHVMPPTGAFGASSGIQDAHNLAWKLALVLKGLADQSLLDTYETERRPVAELMVRQSMLRFEVREGRAFQDVAGEMLDELVMSFGYRYRSGAFTGTADDQTEDPYRPTAAPGARAPHVLLERDGESVSTVDLFARDFVLLTGSGPEGSAWSAAAEEAAERLGIAVRAYLVGPDGHLQDPAGTWARTYGVGEDGAVLVRPDGFVAWRSTSDDPRHPLGDVLADLLRVQTTAGATAG